jgi:hypothetical protein
MKNLKNKTKDCNLKSGGEYTLKDIVRRVLSFLIVFFSHFKLLLYQLDWFEGKVQRRYVYLKK